MCFLPSVNSVSEPGPKKEVMGLVYYCILSTKLDGYTKYILKILPI